MTINIHGKPYVEVKDRVAQFRKDQPEWAISTEVLNFDAASGHILIKASVHDEAERLRATGIAHEYQDDKTSMVNATSYVENCETSAIGRALACLGYGIEESYASADEVQGAIAKQPKKSAPTNPQPASDDWQDAIVPIGKHQGKRLGELAERSRAWFVDNFEANEKYEDSVAFRAALDASVGIMPESKPEAKPDETFQEEASQTDEELDEDVPF